MRWRLTHDLGCAWAHALEIKNLRYGTIYHMIFATDNLAGNSIMSNLYAQAATQIPEMRREAIDRQRGQLRLDLPSGAPESTPGLTYEPPWEPPSGET